jgi:hypothetical protein
MANWDERWLDIHEIEDVLSPIMCAQLELAMAKDCNVVESTYMAACTNGSETKVPLTNDNQLSYNK